MKKNKYVIIIIAILAILALVLVWTKSPSTFHRTNSNFAVDDTGSITKIFMSDKNNNNLKLVRGEKNQWIVNDKYTAQKNNIDLLLKTMHDLEVKEPVSKSAHNNVIRELAASAVKVEIYQMVYRINIFGLKLFRHEKLNKVYYVGGSTQSNRGTYMLMKNSSEPFITFLPGLRGFVSPRYTPIEKYWRDYTIFKKDPREIAAITIEYPEKEDFSFSLVNYRGSGLPRIFSFPENREIPNCDTLKVFSILNAFRNINYEALLNDMDSHRKDSVIASPPFCIISLKDTSARVSTIKIYHKAAVAGSDEYYGRKVPYDLDRMYALVNDGKDFVLVQYFVFDKVLRTRPFFLRETGNPVMK
ncbi:MAG: hypothetical protein Q8867_06590 [Bacteroidota bacterium]|nr:hypothetical protein [Bacteroidota bacterium]